MAECKSYRKGIDVMKMASMFATEEKAREWFEEWLWNGERCCVRCGSENTHRASHKTMPYRCRDCRKYFSVRTGTAMERSKVPLRKWGWAIYLELTNLKGVSSVKLARDLGVTQTTAWFMQHRIREAFAGVAVTLDGPVEVDEAYFGGLRKNMSNERRKELDGTGRGPVGKQAVVAAKDRETKQVVARVVDRTDGETLQGFVDDHAAPDAKLYTDDTSAYRGTDRERETVKHSSQEYVRYLEGETVHTNGVESFWSMLKRAHKGVYHKLSPKHLQRYVNQFAGRHNIRELDTLAQMQHVVMGMVGRRLMYRDLIADNGRSALAG
ncbi:MAG: IS1595 family transposase [Gammaproteobacteria bacterium]|nr:IS1595 family transposase [Gammaproteobacteria bacterium]